MNANEQLTRILELNSKANHGIPPDYTYCGVGVQVYMEAASEFASKAARALKVALEYLEEIQASDISEGLNRDCREVLAAITKELES